MHGASPLPFFLAAAIAVPVATPGPKGHPHRPSAHAAPSAPHAARFPAPEVRVGGYRVVVEKLLQQQNLSVEFPDEGSAAPTGRQNVYVQLAVVPPERGLVANIEGLDPRVVGFSGHTPLTFQAYPAEDSNPLSTGVWRTSLISQDAGLDVSRVERLQGELIVYPRARLVTLDFPIPGTVPQTKSAEGFSATLKDVKTRPGVLYATVEMEWPSGDSVTHVNPEAMDGVTALTRAGATLIPQRGGASAAKRGDKALRQYTLTFSGSPELAELPAKIRVQMMVRSGPPKRLAFTLPDIPLPDTLALEADEGTPGAASGPLSPGHVFYARNGGAISIPVRNADPEGGRLLVGLSRKEVSGFGPWRWMEVTPGSRGVLLEHVAPGEYRVSREWTPPGGRAVSAGKASIVAAKVEEGRTTSTPPLTVGGGR